MKYNEQPYIFTCSTVDYSGGYIVYTWAIIAMALILIKDEALTDEENAMLDSFRKLDNEKRKMPIDTAQAWHKSN